MDARVERRARGASGLAVRRARQRAERKAKRTLILAESRVRAVLGDDYDERWDAIARHSTGSELVGARYRRPLDWLEYPEGANTRSSSARTFVTADDGTGVVHMAPAFGADDYAAGQRHNLAFLQPVDARGEFPDVAAGGRRACS